MIASVPLEVDAVAALTLAAELIRRSRILQTAAERRQQSELDRMIGHDEDKATLVEMTDQAFRTHSSARVADQLTYLLDVQGVPRFFSPTEQAMLCGFQSFGQWLPGVAVPLVKEKMRQETANVILPAEPELLVNHLKARQQQRLTMNLNLLGEALLGERETQRRLRRYYDLLRMPEVKCLSVKLTTLYSQVSPLAREHTIEVVANRLETLYRTANRFHDEATGLGKFVYLDMEEYRDLALTTDTLIETLQRPGLLETRAGVALQAYIPDSAIMMRRLIDWSADRVAQGGVPLTIRLVKGANLEMERVQASTSGWELAPYPTKRLTDANFKSMLRTLIEAAGNGHVRVGVASHNLFDISLALIWTARANAGTAVQFEMLEGMANHQRRAISERDQAMLLYAPACQKSDFLHAIGYLIRRLDENTGEENFLRYSYRLQPDSPEFERLAESFRESLTLIDLVPQTQRRRQDRRIEPTQPPIANHWSELVNEPDTDWSLSWNVDWITDVLATTDQAIDEGPVLIEPVIARHFPAAEEEAQWVHSFDVSRPARVTARVRMASKLEVEASVSVAASTGIPWEDSLARRRELLRRAAQLLRLRRGELIAAMVADAGKSVAEADPEVSEAIDFCEFYPLTVDDWATVSTLTLQPRGVVAVITPWNFPLAIAGGGVAAALAAGNRVLLKPSLETVLPAWLLCQAFWEAGVPIEALQFVPCVDSVAESAIVRDARVDAVVLTGGTDTAKRMLAVRSDLHLLAETGGKNATIVTAMADRDLAIKHVLQSAFGHSGQKCSATSLLLLEAEVFDDPVFRETLADAVESLPVGSAWDLASRVTPLVSPPGPTLTRGLKELDESESWLVMPEAVPPHPTLYRPGVKWNVSRNSFTHLTELFGPVLGVMRFTRLEEAIQIVRSTGYGLTSGLESLDAREIELWKETIPAGNLYINRPMTGAIVLRQPFGGVGYSAYGPGVKAGGPNYVLALSKVGDAAPVQAADSSARDSPAHPPLDRFLMWLKVQRQQNRLVGVTEDRLQAAVRSQRAAALERFSVARDDQRLVGQDNWRRYRPVDAMAMVIAKDDSLTDTLIGISAATAVGTRLTLVVDPAMDPASMRLLESLADWLPGLIDVLEVTAELLAERLLRQPIERLRCLTPLPDAVERACAETFVTIIREPVVIEGRIEGMRYLNEQSISHETHRYGNLGRHRR